MEVLNLILILLGLFLISEGKKVSKVEKDGSVYHINIGSAVDSKQFLGILKSLDKKLNKIMDKLGTSSNETGMPEYRPIIHLVLKVPSYKLVLL